MSLKITNIKNIDLSSISPTTTSDGKWGIEFENIVEKQLGININRRRGVDIPQTNQELKTRGTDSKSDVTVGIYNRNAFVNSNGTIVLPKLQNWLYMPVDKKLSILRKQVNIDWSSSDIQERFIESLEECSNNLPTVSTTTRLYSSDIFNIEKCENSKNSIKVRIKASKFKGLVGMALSNKNFKKHFTFKE